MSHRPFMLISIAALACSAPVAAQDARDGTPPLPPMGGMHEGRMPMRGPMHEPMRGGPRMERHSPSSGPRMGYDAQQRDAWLDECESRHSDSDSRYCEDYLSDYEGAWRGPGFAAPPPAFDGGPAGAPYAYAPGYFTPGYVVPPLMWVRVPIMRERGGCDCQEIIEEQVVAPPAPRARRVIERRIIKRALPGKDLRSTK